MKKTTIAILTCLASATFGFAASKSFTGGQIFDENETYEPLFKGGSLMLEQTFTADFNQDGFGDFAGCHWIGGGYAIISVWLNNQNGDFELVFESSGIEGWGDYRLMNVEDFNNDGFPDILIAVDPYPPGSEPTPLIYINQLGPATACASDLNDDGTTDVTDLLFVVSEWGPCE
jgi:hypothetical protein